MITDAADIAPPRVDPQRYRDAMWWLRWRNVITIGVLIVAVGLYAASVVFGGNAIAWIILPAAFLIVLILRLVFDGPRRPAGPGELYASDPYSDIELGRLRPTHPSRDVTESSQIADPPPRDLLDLPGEDEKR